MNFKNSIKKWVIISSIVWLTLLPLQGNSQSREKIKEKTKRALAINIDNIEDNEIIKYQVAWLIDKYGLEKTIETITKHNLKLINDIRKKHWLVEVKLDRKLCKAAQKHADEMFKKNRYSHNSKNWNTPTDRARKAWYRSKHIKENIGKNYLTIEEAVKSWKESKPHFETIIDPKLTHIWIWFNTYYRVNLFWYKE